MDTEFVSEDTYKPQLCLVQLAVAGRLTIIDPMAINDLSPLWEMVASPGHTTVVHAGRQEFQFCHWAVGKRPAGWFDIQIAAGLVGLEYPAAYRTLIAKLLGRSVSKTETRTEWRRRPLSTRQLEYALQDVLYLEPIRNEIIARIDKFDRHAWLREELETWQEQVESEKDREGWRRLPGAANLTARQLAIARELWQWRESQAETRDCPPRRVLRDDLIVELARRQSADVQRIRAVRGLERRNLQRELPEISERIRAACRLDESLCPRPQRDGKSGLPQLNLLGQFLNTALGSICRAADVAPALVGTTQDVRDLVAFHLELLGRDEPRVPALARGWRAEIVGNAIEDLLSGKTFVRVSDPLAENPLTLERSCQDEG
jgi:ribonuclease D